jgi:hypothetical protein
MVTHLVELSQGRGGINTAYIERLNATFRQRLASLARRTRALIRQPETLHLGMYVIGCVYNFCTYHDSLRQPFYLARSGRRWLRRTPAIAAGLTDHCRTVETLIWPNCSSNWDVTSISPWLVRCCAIQTRLEVSRSAQI